MGELEAISGLNNRAERAVDLLMSTGEFEDKSELLKAAYSYHDKILISNRYKPSTKLLAPSVTLIRAQEERQLAEIMGEDYGLSSVSVCLRVCVHPRACIVVFVVVDYAT